MGLFGTPIPFDLEKVALKELQVTGSFAQKWSAWKRTIRLLRSGQINLQPLITHRYPLTEWKQAFEILNKKEGIKVILDPKL